MSASVPGSEIERRNCGDAAVVAAQLEDLLDHRAVLALEVAGPAVDRLVVLDLLDLDDQPAAQVGAGRARDAAVQALELDCAPAAGEADLVRDLGHRADLGELAVVARHEQHALGVADVDRQRHAHVGEDHCVVQWHEQ